MKVVALEIEGAYEVTPVRYQDDRGVFLEWYRLDHLQPVIGHEAHWVQANLSASRRGVVRGIHVTDVPPGQAKYVTCAHGAIFDVVVDLRVGSPTFGRWCATRLDDVDRKAIYCGEGLGHAFCAISEEATLTYLCSRGYVAGQEQCVYALDPELGITWPVASPVLSDKDKAAPTLSQALAMGVLPRYDECVRLRTR